MTDRVPPAAPRSSLDHGRGSGVPTTAPLNLRDFEALATARLDPGVAAYYSGAAADEMTLADNAAAFRRWRFVPRVGVEIEARDRSVEVLGRRWPAPIMVAPLALLRMADPDGEVAVARACAARGLTMYLSTVASSTIEEVAAAGAPSWFQLYFLRDVGRNRDLLDRAAAAGYEAIVLTIDAPHGGRQLDLTIAALDALPAVVDAVAGRVPVLFDSGIRRGTDILTALGLGASAVMVGRPLVWALAWGGEAGVGLAFDLLLGELDLALALAGVPRAASLPRELLVRAASDPS